MFLKETLPFSHFCFTSPAGWPRSLCGAGHYFASAVVPPTLCCGSLSCSRWRKETRGAVRSRCSGWVAEWYCARNGSGVGGRVCLGASDGGVRVTVIFVCVELQPEAASREVQESVEHCEEPGRCALLGGASGALPSPPSLAYRTTVDPGPLSSAWAAGRSGVFAGFLAVEEQRPLWQRRLWRWRDGQSWWESGSCAWRSAKRRGRSAARADAAGGAGERESSELCHTGTAATRT